ncbi:hypothetical protein DFH27DRAFT_622515 [Peziza echinospora]|nr:hypothetical protein DFH27DRAFT_622515 [Peziza echinospora]
MGKPPPSLLRLSGGVLLQRASRTLPQTPRGLGIKREVPWPSISPSKSGQHRSLHQYHHNLHRPTLALLRSTLPAHTHTHTRALKTTTKSYLHHETILACKIILGGTLLILTFTATAFLGLHAYHEFKENTPASFPLKARLALHASRHCREWEGNLGGAAGYLGEAVREVDGWNGSVGEGRGKKGEEKVGEREVWGYLMELADLEMRLGMEKGAMGRWRRVLEGGGGIASSSPQLSTSEKESLVDAAVKYATALDEYGDLEVEVVGGIPGVEEDHDGLSSEAEREEKTLQLWKKRRAEEELLAEKWLVYAYTLALELSTSPSTAPAAGVVISVTSQPQQQSQQELQLQNQNTHPQSQPGILPESLHNPPNLLLHTATELGVHYSRHAHLPKALPIFLSILRARTDPAANEATADPCEVAKVMSYLGEVLWASGKKKQGLAWVRKAVGKAIPLVEMRGACRDCAVYAAGNEVVMLRKLAEERGGEKKGRSSGSGGWGLWRGGSGGREGEMAEEEEEERRRWEGEIGEAEERLAEIESVRIAKAK